MVRVRPQAPVRGPDRYGRRERGMAGHRGSRSRIWGRGGGVELRVAGRLLGVEGEGRCRGRTGGAARRRREAHLEAERLAGARSEGAVAGVVPLGVVTDQLPGGAVEVAAIELGAIEVVARRRR